MSSCTALCALVALGMTALAAGSALAVDPGAAPGAAPGLGNTRIARWKDDKQAAFLLMFDDSEPSHVQNVVPALVQRGLVGTFYVNPGTNHWKAFAAAWEKQFPAAGMEYGNHTMTHKGVRDLADAEEEIGQCNQVIYRLFPRAVPGALPGALPGARLVSWGQPGVKKEDWNITPAQLEELLTKHHLIARPPFDGHGAAIQHKTAADLQRLLDSALAKCTCEYVIFHGVGGDWITFPLPEFVAFLDQLAAKKDQVWVAGHIPAHQYQTERDGATVKVLEATAQRIRVELTCAADAKLYDYPLTLVTTTPGGWSRCQVMQGTSKAVIGVTRGEVKYEAKPGAGALTLEPATP